MTFANRSRPRQILSDGIASPSTHLLDHLIRPQQERLRDRQPEGLGGLEVDEQVELRRLLDVAIWTRLASYARSAPASANSRLVATVGSRFEIANSAIRVRYGVCWANPKPRP